jgi:hypothetical protein
MANLVGHSLALVEVGVVTSGESVELNGASIKVEVI